MRRLRLPSAARRVVTGHLRARFREKASRANAHRTRAGEDDDTRARHIAKRLLNPDDRRNGRRVRAVRVEHDRHAHGTEERFLHFGEHALTHGHVGAADEDRRVVQILRPAREDRAVDEIAHRVFSDAAIRHHVVGTAIARDDAIEDAGMRRAIELNEELLHTT